jgi:hypothetical protein
MRSERTLKIRNLKSTCSNIDKKMSNLERMTEINLKNISMKEHNLSPSLSTAPGSSPPVTTAPSGPPGPLSTKSPGPQSSHVTQDKSSKPINSGKGKSIYLQKPKILYIGDSVAQNADVVFLERATQSRIRTKKAYSSTHDKNARWPKKNATDGTPVALSETPKEDEFSHLVLAAPTVDISNIDTSKVTANDNIEDFKQKMVISCRNIFAVATNALKTHPNMKNVIIMEHAPRHDVSISDPTQLKSKLAKFANTTLMQLWHSSNMKDRIIIGKHSLDYTENMFHAIYKDDWSGKFDGVHLYGSHGKGVYTRSVL